MSSPSRRAGLAREQIRVTVFPDGGMNRVRVYASP